MTIDHLGAIARDERRRRRLPPHARCAMCGTTDYLLSVRDGRILCYECHRGVMGHRPFEADHLAGRVHFGAISVNVRPNDHRRVTELRIVLGMDQWPSPDDSELGAVAHFLGNLATILWLVATWLVDRIETPGPANGPPAIGP